MLIETNGKLLAGIFRILRSAGPFILGLVIGALVFFLISTWEIDLNYAVKWLASLSLAIFILVVLLWITYRIFIDRISRENPTGIKNLLKSVQNDPSLLSDPSYRARELWPLLPSALQAFVAWFGFTNAVAIGIALVTNLALFATLAVQYLSAERLETQNQLLGFQNGLLATQSDLLETQTVAAATQQILSIDETISRVVTHQDELERIRQSTSDDFAAKVKFEPQGLSVELSNNDMNPCNKFESIKGCENAYILDIANNMSEFQQGDTNDFNQPHYPAFQLLINFLSLRHEDFMKNTGKLRQVLDEPSRDEVAYAQEALKRIGEVCKVSPELVRRSTARLSALRLIDSKSWAYGPRLLEPKWAESAEQFPQIRQNTLGAHLNFTSGLERLSELNGRDFQDQKSYTIAQLSGELSELISDISSDLTSVSNRCEEEGTRLVSIRNRLQEAIFQ